MSTSIEYSLAGDVLRNVETKRAGANPAIIDAPDQTSREATVDRAPAQDEPAHLLDSVRGLTPTSKGKSGKMASAETPAKFTGLSNNRREVEATVTSLPVGRGMESVFRRKQSGIPTRTLSRPVLTVIIGGRHASSKSNSPNSTSSPTMVLNEA